MPFSTCNSNFLKDVRPCFSVLTGLLLGLTSSSVFQGLQGFTKQFSLSAQSPDLAAHPSPLVHPSLAAGLIPSISPYPPLNSPPLLHCLLLPSSSPLPPQNGTMIHVGILCVGTPTLIKPIPVRLSTGMGPDSIPFFGQKYIARYLTSLHPSEESHC